MTGLPGEGRWAGVGRGFCKEQWLVQEWSGLLHGAGHLPYPSAWDLWCAGLWWSKWMWWGVGCREKGVSMLHSAEKGGSVLAAVASPRAVWEEVWRAWAPRRVGWWALHPTLSQQCLGRSRESTGPATGAVRAVQPRLSPGPPLPLQEELPSLPDPSCSGEGPQSPQ